MFTGKRILIHVADNPNDRQWHIISADAIVLPLTMCSMDLNHRCSQSVLFEMGVPVGSSYSKDPMCPLCFEKIKAG